MVALFFGFAVSWAEPAGSLPDPSAGIDRTSREVDSSKIEEFVPKLTLVLKSRPDDPDSTIFGEPELVHGPLETRWNGMSVVLVFYTLR